MDVVERSSIRIIKRVLSASPLLVVIFCIGACSQSARFINCVPSKSADFFICGLPPWLSGWANLKAQRSAGNSGAL